MQNPLNARQQAMIPVAAFTASGDMDNLNRALHDALDAGLTVNEVKEILSQLYAYCGFPRSLNALGCFMAVMTERQKHGIVDEEGKGATPPPQDWDSLTAGRDNQTQLVGQPVSGPLFDFAPAIDTWLKAHLFGDIFQRDVLDWQARELVTLSALAAIPGAESQLQSHYAISLHNGITPAQFHAFVAVLEEKCTKDIAQNARTVLAQFLDTTTQH